jgi:Oxidoreductase family, NAD-binding Rossmann fold
VKIGIVGCGTVGSRAARQLLSLAPDHHIKLFDLDSEIARRLSSQLGRPSMFREGSVLDSAVDVVLIATPSPQYQLAAALCRAGVHVVTTTDSVDDVPRMLALDAELQERGVSFVVGAGFSPGLTDLLAMHAASEFDEIDEIHVAKLGTAGPACARQHHAALSSNAVDWRDGEWITRPGGSGRELCWFPDPIGGADCYRAALPEALLLNRTFPEAGRLTARVAATRRDRLTSRLPMMRKPHAEAGLGAVRVEVRGRRNGEAGAVVLACIDRASVGAGAVASIAVAAIATQHLGAVPIMLRPGAGGLGEFVQPIPFLNELARRGVSCARFEGTLER